MPKKKAQHADTLTLEQTVYAVQLDEHIISVEAANAAEAEEKARALRKKKDK